VAVQTVANSPLSGYPVLVDKNAALSEMQVVRLDVGTGSAESRVDISNGLPVNIVAGGGASTPPDNSTSTAQEASRVVKASAGTLFVVSGFNNHTSDQYIQLFDSASLPANGVVPKIVIRAFAREPFGYRAPEAGRAFSTGIVICNSTTGPTKTIGSANCLFDIQYS
jgi:hypothetical protein